MRRNAARKRHVLTLPLNVISNCCIAILSYTYSMQLCGARAMLQGKNKSTLNSLRLANINYLTLRLSFFLE